MEKGEIGEILNIYDNSTDNEKRGFIRCLFLLKNQEISKLKEQIQDLEEDLKDYR